MAHARLQAPREARRAQGAGARTATATCDRDDLADTQAEGSGIREAVQLGPPTARVSRVTRNAAGLQVLRRRRLDPIGRMKGATRMKISRGTNPTRKRRPSTEVSMRDAASLGCESRVESRACRRASSDPRLLPHAPPLRGEAHDHSDEDDDQAGRHGQRLAPSSRGVLRAVPLAVAGGRPRRCRVADRSGRYPGIDGGESMSRPATHADPW